METSTGIPTVALIGRPNVGKSTLFSRLSGLHRKMGNWEATTVEVGSAEIAINGQIVKLVDLPGTATINSSSPDEQLTVDLLHSSELDLVIAVVDSSNIARCIFLTSQLKELGTPIIVALTMDDIATRRGINVDATALSSALELPVIPVIPRTGKGLRDIENAIAEFALSPAKYQTTKSPPVTDLERLDLVQSVLNAAVTRSEEKQTVSDRTDAILTGRFSGALILFAVLWGVFQATTVLAAPIMDLLSNFIDNVVTPPISNLLISNPIAHGLVVDGVIAGVGTLITFLPVMSIMFILLSILEDSGYMARAAVVSARLMRFAGLPGKALLPLLVGFGCNVPAVSATRTMSDRRHRLITGLTVPFTACSARLAVYVFVAEIFFGKNAGTVVFAMYIVSISLVVAFATILRLTLIKGAPQEPLLIELPPYRLPTSSYVFSDALIRIKGFLKEAGGIVILTVIAVSALMAIPTSSDYKFGNVPVQESAYGQISQSVTPIFEPAGFADWHTTGALITGFVAKEVVISSWGQNYAVSEDLGTTNTTDLGAELQEDFEESSNGHTLPAVLAFLVFLTAYTPCVATVAVQRREFGTKWAMAGIGLQLSVAWILAVLTFQIGSLFA